MKTLLALAIAAALGGVYYYQNQARSARSELETQTAESRDAIRDRDAQIKKLTTEVARLKAITEKPVALVAAKPATTEPESSAPVVAATVAPASPAPAAQPDNKEAEYARRKAAIDARQVEIDAARVRAESYLAQVQSSAPQFSEQSNRYDELGNVIGNKGIRTSKADREKATALYQQQLAAANAGIAKVAEEQAKVDAARGELAKWVNE